MDITQAALAAYVEGLQARFSACKARSDSGDAADDDPSSGTARLSWGITRPEFNKAPSRDLARGHARADHRPVERRDHLHAPTARLIARHGRLAAFARENIKIAAPKQKYNKLPLVVPFETLQNGDATIKAKLTVFYCREDNTGTCNIKTLTWNIPVKIVAGKAANKVELAATVK